MTSRPTAAKPGLAGAAAGRGRSRRDAGFTLMEVLLSVMIVGMLAAIVGMSMQVVVLTWERGEQKIEVIERTRHLIEYMNEDIRSAFLYRGKTETSTVSYFFGDEDRINFIGTSPMLSGNMPSVGLREVSYWVDPNRGLILREAPLLHTEMFSDDRGVELEVSPVVRAAKFEYLYQTYSRVTGELENEWSESWGAGDELADVTDIRVSLNFMDEDIRTFSRRQMPAAVRVTLTVEVPTTDDKTEKLELEPVVIPVMAAQTYEAPRQ